MAWIPLSHPHPGQGSEEPQTRRGKSQDSSFGNFGGPSTETAAENPGVSPQPPFCPCHPLGQLLFPLLLFDHCHSADCAADFGHPGAAFSSLVIRAS